MKIKIKTIFSNGWRGDKETKKLSENELFKYATNKYNIMKNDLFDLIKGIENIYLIELKTPYIIQWEKHSETDPAHQQVRFELLIEKNTRKITANDIYKTVNNVKISYFTTK